MTVVGILTAPALLRIMETPEDTMADSIVYMRWVYMAMIPGMVYNMGSAILRAVGDSKHPLYFLIACCLINVVLDLLFVVTFKMGVAGAAIATALSQLLSAVMICWFLARPKTEESVRLELSKLRTDWADHAPYRAHRPALWASGSALLYLQHDNPHSHQPLRYGHCRGMGRHGQGRRLYMAGAQRDGTRGHDLRRAEFRRKQHAARAREHTRLP